MAFKGGDVVFLKSGGPAMTIARNTDNGGLRCFWFNNHEGVYTLAHTDLLPEMLTDRDPQKVAADAQELELDAEIERLSQAQQQLSAPWSRRVVVDGK